MVMDQRNVANRVACCVRLIKDHFDVLPNTGVLVLNSFNLIKLQWAGNRWGYDVIIQMIECWPNLVQIGAHIHRGCLWKAMRRPNPIPRERGRYNKVCWWDKL